MTAGVDAQAIRMTRLANRITMAVGSGFVLVATAVVLGLAVASDGHPGRRAEGLAICALALVLALVVALLGFVARDVLRRMELDGV